MPRLGRRKEKRNELVESVKSQDESEEDDARGGQESKQEQTQRVAVHHAMIPSEEKISGATPRVI